MTSKQESCGSWSTLFRQLFDSSDAHVALLDLSGEILAVNSAWLAFAAANKLPASYDPVGKNYLHLCEIAAEHGDEDATAAYVGLLEVLRNGRPKFTLVYPCHSPTTRRWFRMWVEPQSPQIPAVVVAHKLIAESPRVVRDLLNGHDPFSIGIGGGRSGGGLKECHLSNAILVAKPKSLAYQF